MARRSDRWQASRSRSKGNSADWRQGARVDYDSSESKISKNPTRLAVDLPRSWARAHGMQLARDRSGIGYVQHQRSRALVGIKPPFGGQPERIAGVHADRTNRDAVPILLQGKNLQTRYIEPSPALEHGALLSFKTIKQRRCPSFRPTSRSIVRRSQLHRAHGPD
jgi:hypothetical protein